MIDKRQGFALDADVLVIGGGAAGVAAAVTAARQNLKVILLERYGFAGGGAVAGLSGTICGLFEAREDPKAAPARLVYGFAEEFVQRMQARGGLSGPTLYGKTYTLVHDPMVWREVGDDLLAESGVQVLYHTVVSDVLMDGGERVAGVVAYNKQGKLRVTAKITIDASGDADVTAMAGLQTYRSLNGVIQNPTMIFRISGVDVKRFLATYGDNSVLLGPVVEMIQEAKASGKYALPREKIFLFPTTRPNELLCNCTRILGEDGRDLDPLNAADLTDAEVQGRKQVREYERFFRDYLVGCENAYVNDTGVQVGIRQSRQAMGVATLANSDVVAGTKFRSGIARSAWPIEQHAGAVPKLEWLFNDYYEIPYECFVPSTGESLLVAGRCLSAEAEAMASARVTAQCFSYGHAIGHAAALAVHENVQPRQIDPIAVREAVNRDGAQLD
ncbi:FAD-dependent oxidoreductase [Candidimonas sp. SYP-B2681]|uniref:FAD-dependent oxidoreductase n=1 Tax=Candidimonas sp. SYP-B2681 TaxID=2497686 RepID=UPI000F87BA99|nr:FAD-dependent oxidoreductase [Candidimonas sp. SYP-B2681]RTZ48120.1 FAD-dependent oxidoreductase [Candidimonas sp. SYP-B2681]